MFVYFLSYFGFISNTWFLIYYHQTFQVPEMFGDITKVSFNESILTINDILITFNRYLSIIVISE